MQKVGLVAFLAAALFAGAATQAVPAFGQQPELPEAKLFAPGVVSTPDRHEFGAVLSRDGREIYFGVDVVSLTEAGTLYFASNVAAGPESPGDFDIYAAEPDADGFQPARRLGPHHLAAR